MSKLPKRDKRYRSDIPRNAVERIVSTHADGSPERTEYYERGQCVGTRQWDEEGFVIGETPLRNGERHGTVYHWFFRDWLLSAEPYVNGKVHGTARQWEQDGRLIGSYTLTHGTGIDLWFGTRDDGSITLDEVWYYEDGQLVGFNWWLNGDQRSVWREVHFGRGNIHGIDREWNPQGRLSRGYPKYFIRGKQVTKGQYLRACRTDPTLPTFSETDNRPHRLFPPELAKYLTPRGRRQQ